MQNFFNNSHIVSQAIKGNLQVSSDKLAVAHPHHKIVVRRDYESNKNKVAIISGGGAGHEPLHSEFVGGGMLTAAVCGEIFASPSIHAILTAILLVTGDQGCLLIVKNYTGDRLNFSLAAEQAKTMGKKVDILLVADDIAIDNPKKRRGIAGTVFIHKIAGYLAEQGFCLEEIKNKCEKAAGGLISLGLSISAADSLEFAPQIGRGIHNEAGESLELDTTNTAKSAVNKVLDRLVPKTDHNSSYAVMINNLGGLKPLEMSIITNEVLQSTFKDKIKYVVGPALFCTSLNMRGFSLSLLKLTDDIEKALLSPVKPSAWVQPVEPKEPELIDVNHINLCIDYTPSENETNFQIIQTICDVLIASKDELNKLDAHGGDGDSGDTLASIADHIINVLDNIPLDNTAHLLLAIGQELSSIGVGTSGVLLSLLFTRSGIALEKGLNFSSALKEGVEVMMKYAGSQVGDRSLLDSLVPAIQALQDTEDLKIAAKAAREGANQTANMEAKVGRAANVPRSVYDGFNDSGAEAIALIFEGLVAMR